MTACRHGDPRVSPNPNLRALYSLRRALSFGIAIMAGLSVLLSCSLESPPSEVYINQATAKALTPTATSTPVPPTATPTVTPTGTPPPTATAIPTQTPIPTPTTNPQLADLGYCRTSFGPADGARFSARLASIEAHHLDLVDQITLTFSDTKGLVHGSVRCIDNSEWDRLEGRTATEAPGPRVLAINLDAWAHDDAWVHSPLTQTASLTGAPSFGKISFAADPLSSRGTTIGIGLATPLSFRVRLEDQPVRLIVEVDRNAHIEQRDDPLGQPAGTIEAPTRPIFFLQNYDVWKFADGRAQPLTTTDTLETSLAVSPDGETLAVCRAPGDSDPAMLPYGVRASLWVMRATGSEERMLADVGGCADLQFAPSGKTISFTANTAAAPPTLLSVWIVPVVGGEPHPATPVGDEWNRYGATWLPDSRLIYHARQGADLSVLFIRENDGSEHEVTSQLLTGATYSGIGQFVVGDNLLAVEALRGGEDGADLVLLRFDGTEIAVERRAFWQRPLAFLPDGLIYLSTECPSSTVQQYTLLRRKQDGTTDELLHGSTLGGIGDVVAAGARLLIARLDRPASGVRGPQGAPADGARASLWLISPSGSARHELYQAPVSISNLGTGSP